MATCSGSRCGSFLSRQAGLPKQVAGLGLDLEVSGKGLENRIAKLSSKAAGPDGWQPAHVIVIVIVCKSCGSMLSTGTNDNFSNDQESTVLAVNRLRRFKLITRRKF